MKAPKSGMTIRPGQPIVGSRGLEWEVIDDATGRRLWVGSSFRGARDAHARMSIARITGKDPGQAVAKRMGS